MKAIRTFRVTPNLPEPLQFLNELAYNLWWSWNSDARNLFREVDPELWEQSRGNPVVLLGQVPQKRLDDLAQDEGFLGYMREVHSAFHDYMHLPPKFSEKERVTRFIARQPEAPAALKEIMTAAPPQQAAAPPGARPRAHWETTWFDSQTLRDPKRRGMCIGYFSAEYGLDACLPIYSGGLGVLAGDHLKASSDLGLPLVAVGLCYSEGYFRQYLNHDGWQQERYPANDFNTLPMTPEVRDGQRVRVTVRIGERDVHAQVWRVQVGRIPLFLLDTNIADNHVDDRALTARLYGGRHEDRLRAEIMLGIGGLRTIQELGLDPTVLHLNEGHAVFASLERCRQLSQGFGLQFAEAQEAVAGTTIFTTHTPVPAGNTLYGLDLMARYFHDFWPQMKLGEQAFFSLGRQNAQDMTESFGMTVCALRMSRYRNGVSELHGEVSRNMWKTVWPRLPVHEVPIGHITNGVHVPTWISAELGALLDRYLGPRWVTEPGDADVWQRVKRIPRAELWRAHERRRERLVAYTRQRLRASRIRRGEPAEVVERSDDVLDPQALTIAFARRFATYKRATLLFQDFERLSRILTDRDRPVQIIIAGKAHPHDEPGKKFIQEIVKKAMQPEVWRHIVFLEDYEMNMASYLVQGADVWLNTPRRPMEASGTSGMKAGANGVLNCSILDGWWVECFNGENGWAIGSGEEYSEAEHDYQDAVEGRSLIQLLEREIVPLFYDRGADYVPRRWVDRMKNSIATVAPVFNSSRQVIDYARRFYTAGTRRYHELFDDDFRLARNLGNHLERLRIAWHQLWIGDVEVKFADDGALDTELPMGTGMVVNATVHLGPVKPEDIRVELCHAEVVNVDGIERVVEAVPMTVVGPVGDGQYRMTGSMTATLPGEMGIAIRILPTHPQLQESERVPNLVKWA